MNRPNRQREALGRLPDLVSEWEIQPREECIRWTGHMDSRNGYGRGTPHRRLMELILGPIPPELVIDHVCHNADADCRGGKTCSHRSCVNPAHLALSTRGDNVRDGATSRRFCKSGHVFAETEMWRICQDRVMRICRECRNSAQRASRGAST